MTCSALFIIFFPYVFDLIPTPLFFNFAPSRHLRRHKTYSISRNYRSDRVVPPAPVFFTCHPDTPDRCRQYIRQCDQSAFDNWRNGLGQKTNICNWTPAECFPYTEGCVNYNQNSHHNAGQIVCEPEIFAKILPVFADRLQGCVYLIMIVTWVVLFCPKYV